jgi:hypothetical protein
MPKQFVTPTYTFTPGASGVGTLALSGIESFDPKRLVAVINQTRGVVIYATGAAATRYTAVAGNTLTLFADTSTHNGADQLQVIYEQPDETLESIDSRLNGDTGELVQAIEAMRMAVQALTRSVGQSYPDTGGRLRVVIDAMTNALTLSNVTTVSNLTNQIQVGGYAANDQVPSLMHLQADGLRANITVS